MSLRKLSQSFKITLALMLSVLSSGILQVAPAYATNDVTLCHATGSESHPFESISVAAAAAYNGHLGSSQNHQSSEDIIPPFTWQGQTYSQNWDAESQVIYNNGTCSSNDDQVTPLPMGISDVCGLDNDTVPSTSTGTYTIVSDTTWSSGSRTITYEAVDGLMFDQSDGWFVSEDGKTAAYTYTDHATACPTLPDDNVIYTDWVDGQWGCGEETVTQSRTKTTTPYVFVNGLPVLDLANQTITTETQTRDLTDEEQFECPPKPVDLCKNVQGIQTQSNLDQYAPYVFVQGEKTCKITICHRTNAVKNPYRMISVSLRAVDGQGNNDHSHHEGPIFDPATMENGDDWGDIIPPNFHDEDGYNWTAGQALYENDCKTPRGVTPGDPVFKDFCGTSHDFYRIPNREGIIYRVNGEVATPGFYAPGVDEITVTAEAADGYVLKQNSETEWSFEYTDENCLTITKTVEPLTDTNKDGVIGVGDIVTWTITVTNTGDQKIEKFDVSVFDEMADIEGDTVVTLEKGESATFTAYSTITREDIGEVCRVTNTASFGANYSMRDLERTLEDTEENGDYEFTGSVTAEATFTCPTPGRVLGENTGGGQGGGKVLATSTQLPATLPATGGNDNPFMIIIASLIAYGAAYFLQGRRILARERA